MKSLRFTKPLATAATLLLTLAGCAVGPPYQKPEVPAPPDWRTQTEPGESLGAAPWWHVYQDPVLTNLIATALAHNFDARVAASRVEEAYASYRAQRASLLPWVDASASWTRGRVGDLPPSPGVTSGQFDLFGMLSYELDFWGRLRQLAAGARARALASQAAQRQVQIGLVANVAARYFDLRALDRQLEIARETFRSRTNSLELTRIKYNEVEGHGQGIVSELDVRQAETQVHVARSSIARLERALAQSENGLKFLTGELPGPIPRGNPLSSQFQPPQIPAGLPSELLLRRPDVRAAEEQLLAAHADVRAARAALFPNISLTAALGLQSVELEDLFSPGVSRAWRFTPQLTAPIFQGGRLRGNAQAAEARRQAALAEYHRTIYQAFREVNDGLIALRTLREQLEADELRAQAEHRRLQLSLLRYEEGVASYSDVLDAERFLFNAQLEAVQTQADLLIALAQLHKALGGGPPVL